MKIGADEDSLVLDSFAGSGTTAQAVLELNKEDGGNRRFILVEMEDYADKLTAERVRRVIKGVSGARDEKLRNGLGGSFSFFRLGDAIDVDGILSGQQLPSYSELARYLFYTATGEQFDSGAVDEARNFIGESSKYVMYLIYRPDLEFLQEAALTLDFAKNLPPKTDKERLVFAPTKYLDLDNLEDDDYIQVQDIKYVQLPYEIFRYQV